MTLRRLHNFDGSGSFYVEPAAVVAIVDHRRKEPGVSSCELQLSTGWRVRVQGTPEDIVKQLEGWKAAEAMAGMIELTSPNGIKIGYMRDADFAPELIRHLEMKIGNIAQRKI